METLVYIALFSPLFGCLVSGSLIQKSKTGFTGFFTSFMLGISLISSLILFYFILTTNEIIHVQMMEWLSIGNLIISFGFIADPISVTMMCVVTIISTLVHIYSIGYMKEDKSFNRFFCYLSAFVFSMMILVMSDNFISLFIGWEGVGLCSWLLIGFWYHKKDELRDVNPSVSPSWAANEAFIMNRVADLGFLVGLFLMYWNIGSFQYDIVFAQISELSNSTIALIAIFLFIGAMGKSAQFPFQTWLCNAMEGPTPVSALIHSATMVTAGVYLVIRANFIFIEVPQVGYFIACLGAFVAIFAASMALVCNDIKKIIAYSTLSQLGYMFTAVGLGAYSIALFHLVAHAFFKSVLFLGAGNVIHTMKHEQNIKKMGGLHSNMKAASIIMTIASLALCGIFPLAGFYSKDKILEAVFYSDTLFLWFVLYFTAGLTAFYSFRLIVLVFHGKRHHDEAIDLSSKKYPFVIAAMVPLAIFSIITGWFEHTFFEFISNVLPFVDTAMIGHLVQVFLIAITLAVSLGVILYAVFKYKKGGFDKKWEGTGVYKVLINAYYIPWFYEKVICKGYRTLSEMCYKADVSIIDGVIHTVVKAIYNTGEQSSIFQNRNISKSLLIMVIGIVVFLFLGLMYSFIK